MQYIFKLVSMAAAAIMKTIKLWNAGMHLKVCSMHDVWWERGMNISTLSFYVSMAMTQKCVQSIQIVLVYNVYTSISSNRFRYLSIPASIFLYHLIKLCPAVKDQSPYFYLNRSSRHNHSFNPKNRAFKVYKKNSTCDSMFWFR